MSSASRCSESTYDTIGAAKFSGLCRIAAAAIRPQAEAAKRGRMGAGEVTVGCVATWKIRTGNRESSGSVRPQRGHSAAMSRRILAFFGGTVRKNPHAQPT